MTAVTQTDELDQKSLEDILQKAAKNGDTTAASALYLGGALVWVAMEISGIHDAIHSIGVLDHDHDEDDDEDDMPVIMEVTVPAGGVPPRGSGLCDPR
jgi:hypothetical protein